MSAPTAGPPQTGGCQCGAVRYEASSEMRAVYVCHCRECRRQSASAFGISVVVAAESLHLVAGQPRTWSRPTARGHRLECAFCPDCGSRLWHAEVDAGTVSLKGGSLDRPPDLGRAVHIWTSRKLPGVVVPAGATQFPEEPD